MPNVPGIPEGFEMERYGVPEDSDYFLRNGMVMLQGDGIRTLEAMPILCKRDGFWIIRVTEPRPHYLARPGKPTMPHAA